MSSITLSGLSGMDFDSVKISGTPVSEITPDYSGTDKVVIDLSNVDLSGTGFERRRSLSTEIVGLDYVLSVTEFVNDNDHATFLP